MDNPKLINLTNGVITKEILKKIENMDIIKKSVIKGDNIILRLGKDAKLPDDCTKLFNNVPYTQILFDDGIDTSNVTNMEGMFSENRYLDTIKGLEHFDTSNVTNMKDMFKYSSQLQKVDLSHFNYDKVEDLSGMFAYDSDLSINGLDEIIDKMKELSWTKSFNILLDNEDSTNYFEHIDIYSTFGVETKDDKSNEFDKVITINKGELNAIPIRKILSCISEKVSNNDELIKPGDRCKLVLGENVKLIDNFNWQKGIMYSINFGTLFTIESIEFKKGIDSKSVRDMSAMFMDCMELTEIKGLEYLDVSNVESMDSMFCNCSSLKTLTLPHLNTSNLMYMESMFEGCSNLVKIQGFETFDTSNVEEMSSMFKDCSSLETLNLSHFNTSNVTNMSYMFDCCNNLKEIKGLEYFDTSNVTFMKKMFTNCFELKKLNLNSFDTSKVNYMDYMFAGCDSIEKLDLSSFDTKNVVAMDYMFAGCDSIEKLDLSSFDTKNVVAMEYMFKGCTNLKELNIDNFNTESVYSMDSMFRMCESLESLNLSSFDYSTVSILDNILDGCENLYHVDGYEKLSNEVEEYCVLNAFRNCDKLVAEKIDINVSEL